MTEVEIKQPTPEAKLGDIHLHLLKHLMLPSQLQSRTTPFRGPPEQLLKLLVVATWMSRRV